MAAPATADGGCRATADALGPASRAGRSAGWRPVAAPALLVWLVAGRCPTRSTELTPGGVRADPARGACCCVALALVLPAARPPACWRRSFGLVLGVLVVVKVLDMGFYAALDRPFDPVTDWGYLGPGVGVLGDSVGADRRGRRCCRASALLVRRACWSLMPLAVGRADPACATGTAAPSLRAVAALGVVWVAVRGRPALQFAPGRAGRLDQRRRPALRRGRPGPRRHRRTSEAFATRDRGRPLRATSRPTSC